jgi:sigma-E factor negative regulatory protein RseB
VLIDESRGRGLLSSRLRASDDGFLEHYRVSLGAEERVAGRKTREVRIEPVDEFRYGFLLWLDQQTGLLLKSAVVGVDRKPVEELIFTSIVLPDSIPENAVRPEVSEDGFERRTLTEPERPPARAEDTEPSPWRFGWLPPGFSQSVHSRDALGGTSGPVEHLVFTDGLAAFSVYLEAIGSGAPLEGATQVGGLSAYGRRLGDHQVTVLGEVPSETAGRVARAIERR